MKLRTAALLLPFMLAGCRHGAAVRTVSEATTTRYVVGNKLVRQEVREVRMADADGREWTETEIIASKTVPGGLAGLQAEQFEEAKRKAVAE